MCWTGPATGRQLVSHFIRELYLAGDTLVRQENPRGPRRRIHAGSVDQRSNFVAPAKHSVFGRGTWRLLLLRGSPPVAHAPHGASVERSHVSLQDPGVLHRHGYSREEIGYAWSLYWTDEYRIELQPLTEAPARELLEIVHPQFRTLCVGPRALSRRNFALQWPLARLDCENVRIGGRPALPLWGSSKGQAGPRGLFAAGRAIFCAKFPESPVMSATGHDRQTVTQEISAEIALLRLAELAGELGSKRVREEAKALAQRTGEGRFYIACIGQYQARKINATGRVARRSRVAHRRLAGNRRADGRSLRAFAQRTRALSRRNVDGYFAGRSRAICFRRSQS